MMFSEGSNESLRKQIDKHDTVTQELSWERKTEKLEIAPELYNLREERANLLSRQGTVKYA